MRKIKNLIFLIVISFITTSSFAARDGSPSPVCSWSNVNNNQQFIKIGGYGVTNTPFFGGKGCDGTVIDGKKNPEISARLVELYNKKDHRSGFAVVTKEELREATSGFKSMYVYINEELLKIDINQDIQEKSLNTAKTNLNNEVAKIDNKESKLFKFINDLWFEITFLFEGNKTLPTTLLLIFIAIVYIFGSAFIKRDLQTNKSTKPKNSKVIQQKTFSINLPSLNFTNLINEIILKLKKINFVNNLNKKGYIRYAIVLGIAIILLPGITNNSFGYLNPLNLFNSSSKYDNVDPKTLSVEERRSYNCVKVFGFKKGSDKFKDCVFKIYQTELEIQKLETQKQLAEKELRIAEANAKAATERARADQLAQQSAMERQEALLQQQSAAAQRQAAAAAAQARQAEIQSSLQMMQQGLQMMQPRSSPRLQTTCTNLGAFINCW